MFITSTIYFEFTSVTSELLTETSDDLDRGIEIEVEPDTDEPPTQPKKKEPKDELDDEINGE